MHLTLFSRLLFFLTITTTTLAQTLSALHFPYCAQLCAYNVPTAPCAGTDDACMCTNIPYLTTIAACIGSDCNAAGIATSADVFISDCNTSGVEFAMSKSEFVAAANGAVPSSQSVAVPTRTTAISDVASPTDASPTTSDTASETTKATITNTPKQTGGSEGGLSTSDKIALGVGIGFGIPAVISAMATCWMCMRRHRS